jgi:hypothetical protein
MTLTSGTFIVLKIFFVLPGRLCRVVYRRRWAGLFPVVRAKLFEWRKRWRRQCLKNVSTSCKFLLHFNGQAFSQQK